MGRLGSALGVAVLLLAGCSGSSESAPALSAAPDSPTSTLSDSETTITTTTEPTPASPDPGSDSDSVSSASGAPLQPGDDSQLSNDQESNDTTAWLSRRSMSATSIELQWSAPEGAATYQLHRLPFDSDSPSSLQPDASAMTAANEIYTTGAGNEVGDFTDTSVATGTKYWYGIRGLDDDGQVLSTGWHRADAVTDNEAPSPVQVSVDLVDGAVQLTWSEPDENYELHGYRILRAVDGQELETVVTSWDLDRTSFVDDDPPAGNLTYAVEAFDFHWNDSEPLPLEVDLS